MVDALRAPDTGPASVDSMSVPRISGSWRVALLGAICCAGGLLLLAPSADSSTPSASASSIRPRASAASISRQETAELRRYDRGVYVAFCPRGEQLASIASRDPPGGQRAHAATANAQRAHAAEANHTGWPPDECLKMDKGSPGLSHTLVGLEHVHNWLLGGYGSDTIYAGAAGDVVWGDYHPEGQPESQSDYIHGGAGDDWIYSSHGYNEIWTGAGDDHLALVYGHGTVICNGAGVKTFVMRYLPQNRPWTLIGCSHKVLVRYRA
jgi:hypothetical protein